MKTSSEPGDQSRLLNDTRFSSSYKFAVSIVAREGISGLQDLGVTVLLLSRDPL